MKLLRDLLNLTEGVKDPVEVADVIKSFPSKYEAALRSMWGKPALCFKGLPFFGSEGSDFYDQLDDAVSAFCKSRKFDGLTVELESFEEYDGKNVSVEYEDKSDPTEVGQECYVGYSPSKNILLVGYDSHLDEDTFNEKVDAAWFEMFDEGPDEEDSDQRKVMKDIWKQWKELTPCLVFEVDVVKGKVVILRVADLSYSFRGFYSKGLAALKQEYSDLIDLRLD